MEIKSYQNSLLYTHTHIYTLTHIFLTLHCHFDCVIYVTILSTFGYSFILYFIMCSWKLNHNFIYYLNSVLYTYIHTHMFIQQNKNNKTWQLQEKWTLNELQTKLNSKFYKSNFLTGFKLAFVSKKIWKKVYETNHWNVINTI